MDAYLIDEVMGVAYHLEPGSPPTTLLSTDSLTPILSAERALSSASTIVYVPKYTHIDDRRSRLNDLSWHMERIISSINGSPTMINMLPVGFGENSRLMALVESRTGRRPPYLYAPIFLSGPSGVLGSSGDAKIPGWLSDLGEAVGLEEAERIHFGTVFSKVLPSFISASLGSGPSGYIRDLARGMLESFLVGSTVEASNPLYNLHNFMRKSFTAYLKRLVSTIKQLLKERGMKISRARILVSWSYDARSARGEGAWALSRLKEALTSAFVDVSFESPSRLTLEKRDLILICTPDDEKAILSSSRWLLGKILLKASVPEPKTIEV